MRPAAEAPVLEQAGSMQADTKQPTQQPQTAQQPQVQQQDAPAPSAETKTPSTVVVDVTGKNYAFSKKEIRVKEGDVVTIQFTSESGYHDWVVDEFKAATAKVRDGGKTSVTFTASKKGTFEYYCSVGSHRSMGMVGNLIVE
jgi:plastocyanin